MHGMFTSITRDLANILNMAPEELYNRLKLEPKYVITLHNLKINIIMIKYVINVSGQHFDTELTEGSAREFGQETLLRKQ